VTFRSTVYHPSLVNQLRLRQIPTSVSYQSERSVTLACSLTCTSSKPRTENNLSTNACEPA